ncbi:Protein phosphatase methylesterase 1 [Coemansia sp. RSA 2703]|nr:Protein phosphatase methylesterase 1 [Coemansia sp. RSA 2703]KAJ2363634.1 Protein phosphatase methylesterase 1 [Coemansia sp. RSA 2607]KAJ2381771.1 Protein phosphatase methylesterase 1 [Coemansia sp. RSA 2603]
MDLRQSMFKARAASVPDSDEHTDSAMYQPLSWRDYFETQQTINTADSAFNVYASGLSNPTGPVFIFHHGAGHSGLSFGLVCKHIRKTVPESTVIAPDARGHGLTTGENQDDLSIERLVADHVAVAKQVLGDVQRDIVLVGHSMGGAVAAHVAASKLLKRVVGLVLIDIVEGTAMDSLSAIPMFIAARPQAFGSVQSAIKWHIDSESIQNLESARLSVPSLVTKMPDADTWTWRTELLPTEKYWRGWYTGLSKTFVSAPTAKLLVLAGSDRLDKELLIAQMQGKFQLELLPAAGHTIQEDLPNRVGDTVVSFWRRNQPLDIAAIRRQPLK